MNKKPRHGKRIHLMRQKETPGDGGKSMSINIALTEEQRGLLQTGLEIARDKFKEHAKSLLVNSANVRLADQFDKQADEAEKLLTWITNAENVIVEEARD